MAAEGWLTRAADAIWAHHRAPAPYPRSLEPVARYGFGCQLVALPGLRLALVCDWLRQRGCPLPEEARDRPLRGCLVAAPGARFLFTDRRDPEDERRYTTAHELAHLWLEIEAPREGVRQHLGAAALAVVDGCRPPTAAERLRAWLHRVPLGVSCHLLERDSLLGLADGGTLLAEERADRLALELLAPEEEAICQLPGSLPWREWVPAGASALAVWAGLPATIAEAYARRLAPAVEAGPSFIERLSGVR